MNVSCLEKHDSSSHIIGINNYFNRLTLFFPVYYLIYLQVAFSASVLISEFGK